MADLFNGEGTEAVNDRKVKTTVLEHHGYKWGNQIGHGSYAKVKLAFSSGHNCLVAVKIITKDRTPKDFLVNFLPRELAVVRGLEHPNLIRYHQSIETTHRVFIIMEYAENGSLLDLITKEKKLKEDLARKLYKDILSVVEYIHSKGIVHRDIKCENLLFNKENVIKLIDFGFARSTTNSQELSDTFCGSFAYASPEIIKGVPYHPMASDVYATGVVLYAMVIGHLPFNDASVPKLLKQIQAGVVFPKSAKDVSIEVKTLIKNVLSPVKFRPSIPEILKEPWMLIVPKAESESREELKQPSVDE